MKHPPVKGFVYILSNPKYKGLFKVGKTKSDPAVRAKYLSQNSGTIGEFDVVWSREVPHIKLAEDILHYKFRRWWKQKEFYKLPLEQAIDKAEKSLKNIFRIEEAIEKAIVLKRKLLKEEKRKTAKKKPKLTVIKL